MRLIPFFLTFFILVSLSGCTGSSGPVTPDVSPDNSVEHTRESNRGFLGFWDVRIESPELGVEIIPNREVSMHLNVVKLLEKSPYTDCLTIDNESWLQDNVFQCDLEITHPYDDMPALTVFDVRGIFMTHGETHFPKVGKRVSYSGIQPLLLSPDGYANLFNPNDFPVGDDPKPLFEYYSGKFANDSLYDLKATLNPFTAFGIANPRRMFEAGSSETETIGIQYNKLPMVFGYAVDASWVLVDEVVDPIEDFPPDANCLEPYEMKFQVTGELLNILGSSAMVGVEISDHQGIETVGEVTIECPTLFSNKISLDYNTQTGSDTWEFTGEITNEFGAIHGTYPVLVTAQSVTEDQNLGELNAYWVDTIIVECSPPEFDNLIWAKHAPGDAYTGGHKILTLQDDSVVVAGKFNNTVTFGAGEANETELISDYWADWFTAKYGQDGSLSWAKGTLSEDDHEITGITSLSDDSIVVCGFFDDSLTLGNGEPGETTLTAAGYSDVFLARYSSDGSLAWAERAGGFSTDEGLSIAALPDDSIVISGTFHETATFGEGDPSEITLNSFYYNMFVARYTSNGELLWAIQTGGNEYKAGNGISTLSDSSFIIAGFFNISVTFGEGEPNETTLTAIAESTDIFIARYNPDGQLVWAKSAGGPSEDYAFDITKLSDNSTVVTGWFKNSATFGAGESSETTLNATGGYLKSDIFISRFNPDGSLVWAKSAGGDEDNQCEGITSLSDDSIIITGEFYEPIVFEEDETNETTLVCFASGDIFAAAYAHDGSLIRAIRFAADGPASALDITSLSDDSYVITGCFTGALPFGECSSNETMLNSTSGYDCFIASHSPL